MATSRRQKILAESARLFSECGLSATTIREIADAVGLNSGTLYHYFSSKDAILSEILTAFLADLVNHYDTVLAVGGTARERLTAMVRVSLEVADQHPYATEVYQNEYENLTVLPDYGQIAQSVEASHRAWEATAAEGVRNGEFQSGIDVFEFQRMMRQCVFQSVRWHRDTLAADIATITATVTSLFFDGFAPVRAGQTDTRLSPVRRPGAQDTAAMSVMPATTVNELRSEIDILRSDLQAVRDAMEGLSGHVAINDPADA